MIKIRSTQLKATSTRNGLCDVTRQMTSFKEDTEKGVFTIIVKDELFQEKTVQKIIEKGSEPLDIIERKIIETRQAEAFSFKKEFIDEMFKAIGSTISSTKDFSVQFDKNKTSILIAQTIQASETGWHTMTNWIEDTEFELVNEFTKDEANV